MPLQLADLDSQLFAIGKGALFYSPTAWDFSSDLHAALLFLGFTEGEIGASVNETYNQLMLQEYTGDAPHKTNIQGEAPVVTAPLFVADPSLRAILSPSGAASGGFRRQRPVQERTLVIIPEELFLDLDDPAMQTELPLVPDGSGGWLLGTTPLTAAQTALLGQSAWFWRGYFRKPDLAYRHEDGGKLVQPVEFHVMNQTGAPLGHRLYTLGDPYDAGIDVETGISAS